MIETEVFKELSPIGPKGEPTPDLIGDAPPEDDSSETKCCGLIKARPKTRTKVSCLEFATTHLQNTSRI